MTLSQRKFLGTVAMLVWVIVYALLAVTAAIILQVHDNWFIETGYYIVAGLAWVPPAMLIISWMHPRSSRPVAAHPQPKADGAT